MIKSLELINSQAHEKLSLELHPRLNVIYGGNDSGKSTIARILEWLWTNKPRGDWMLREDINGELHKTTVKMLLDSNSVVKRLKGDGDNYYELDGEKYSEFGSDIPEEIKKVFGFDYEYLKRFGKLINVEGEEDTAFLHQESGPQRAAIINYLTNVKLFNDGVKKCATRISATQAALSKNTSDIVESNELVNSTERLSKFNKARLIKKQAKRIELASELEKLTHHKTELANIRRFLKIGKPLKQAIDKLSDIKQRLILTLSVKRDLTALNDAVSELTKLKSAKPIKYDFDGIKENIDKVAGLEFDISTIQENVEAWRCLTIEMKNELAMIEELSIEKTKTLGDTCPVCGSKLRKEKNA